MFCRSCDNLPIPIHHFLIITIHKINLYTGNPPFLIKSKSLFIAIVLIYVRTIKPQPATYILQTCIFKYLLHIQLRCRFSDIGIRFIIAPIPLPVYHHIRPALNRSKIYILLNHVHFHFHLSTPPMIPGGHSRFYPRRIFNSTWRIQSGD